MLNSYDHPDAEQPADHVAKALPGVGVLLRRAREAEAPVVYVNDNYGDWHSTFYETPLEYLLDQMGIGRLVLSGQVTEQCILYSALDPTYATSTWWSRPTRSPRSTTSSGCCGPSPSRTGSGSSR
jgi:nicotinamidase-related amidase